MKLVVRRGGYGSVHEPRHSTRLSPVRRASVRQLQIASNALIERFWSSRGRPWRADRRKGRPHELGVIALAPGLRAARSTLCSRKKRGMRFAFSPCRRSASWLPADDLSAHQGHDRQSVAARCRQCAAEIRSSITTHLRRKGSPKRRSIAAHTLRLDLHAQVQIFGRRLDIYDWPRDP